MYELSICVCEIFVLPRPSLTTPWVQIFAHPYRKYALCDDFYHLTCTGVYKNPRGDAEQVNAHLSAAWSVYARERRAAPGRMLTARVTDSCVEGGGVVWTLL